MKIFICYFIFLYAIDNSILLSKENRNKIKDRKLGPGVTVGMKETRYKKIPKNKLKPLDIHFKIPIKYAEEKNQSPIVVIP